MAQVNAQGYPTLDAAVAALTNGDVLYMPNGQYPRTSVLDLSALRAITIVGDGIDPFTSSSGTVIIGNVAGDLVRFAPPGSGSIRIEGITFRNTNPGGTAFNLSTMGVVNQLEFRRAQFVALAVGLNLGTNCFTGIIDGCKFNGQGAKTYPGSIGLMSGSTNIGVRGCDLTAWGEGARLSGAGNSLHSCRLEVNGKALRTGVAADGTSYALSRSSFTDLSMEANNVGIEVHATADCVFMAIDIQGSTGAPVGNSVNGIIVTAPVSGVSFESLGMVGNYTDAGFAIRNGPALRASCERVNVVNALGGKTWDIGNWMGGWSFKDCN